MGQKLINAADLRVGDVILTSGDSGEDARIEVLRLAEDRRDIFGRVMQGYWSRGLGEHAGREGFMTYGPGGVCHVETPRPPA